MTQTQTDARWVRVDILASRRRVGQWRHHLRRIPRRLPRAGRGRGAVRVPLKDLKATARIICDEHDEHLIYANGAWIPERPGFRNSSSIARLSLLPGLLHRCIIGL